MKKRVMKTRHFSRWARKAGLTDETLCKVIGEMEAGAVGASLGGGVYKKRIALSGRGKRGGARTLIATNFGGLWVFLFGFEKNEMENIEPSLLPELKKYAKYLLAQPPSMLEAMLATGEMESVNYG